jgi:hypothetical protein
VLYVGLCKGTLRMSEPLDYAALGEV